MDVVSVSYADHPNAHLIYHFVATPQFEMLTGSLPFQGKDRKETMALILKWVSKLLSFF